MSALRVAWRLLAIAAVTAVFYPLWLLGSMLTFASPPLRLRWRAFCFRYWSRSLLAALNGRVEVRGAPPEPPFFLVANHLSYIDVLVLAGEVDAVFVAKSEVAGWPILGRLCRSIGTLFIDRNLRRDVPRVIAEIDRLLAAGRGVVLFPEGTSTAGVEVGPFRPALLEPAARAGYPVSWASLTYSTPEGAPPAHLAICWWSDIEFPRHLLGLLGLSGFTARLTFGDGTVQESDRKLLAERLRAEIGRRFTPVVDGATVQESA